MNYPAHIESFLDTLGPTLQVVDEVLNEWNGEGCLQFPILVSTITLRLNWTEKQSRVHDPIIREYVRNHPDWYVTRGAHGGIMKATEKQKKDAAIEAKKKAKEEIKAAIEAKTAALKQSASSTPAIVTDTNEDDNGEDNTNIVSE